jgi:hypothetical protein
MLRRIVCVSVSVIIVAISSLVHAQAPPAAGWPAHGIVAQHAVPYYGEGRAPSANSIVPSAYRYQDPLPPSISPSDMPVPPSAASFAPANQPVSARRIQPSPYQQFFFRGWLNGGMTGNPDDPDDHWNRPLGFNDRSNEFQVNQLYLTMGRAVRQDDVWDIGGRIDFLYGTDYRYTQALGLETHRTSLSDNHWNSDDGPFPSGQGLYGLAMPQAYAELRMPLGTGMSVKMGHFYSIMGYESVMAPNNFFYSHSYATTYGEPMTHTGLLCSYELRPGLTTHLGFTRGWDTWDSYVGNNELSVLGGVQWVSPSSQTSAGFTFHTGDEPIVAAGFGGGFTGFTNSTSYSLVLSHYLTSHLQYVFQHDLGVHNDAAYNLIAGTREDAIWYGINQYFILHMTDTLSFAVRAEWFRDENNWRVLRRPSVTDVTGDDYCDVTVGFNWRPSDRLMIRPEARWDWSGVEGTGFPAFGGMFNEKSEKSQFTFGIDATLFY